MELPINSVQWARRLGVAHRYAPPCRASQRAKGISKELIKRTQAVIGEEVSIILLSAPGAMSYYPPVGFQQAENAFVIKRKK